MKASKLLSEALKILKRPGAWTKGQFHGIRTIKLGRKVDCYCALGAMQEVSRSREIVLSGPEYTLARDCLNRVAQSQGYEYGIVALNDSEKTKKHHVIEAFEKSIRLARKEERGEGRQTLV